jgi:hypothetical protein
MQPRTEAFRQFQYPTVPLGTSASGFRAEVEAEQALARGEHLLAVIDKHEHEHLTGPAAGEAARRLRPVARALQAAGLPQHRTDRGQQDSARPRGR